VILADPRLQIDVAEKRPRPLVPASHRFPPPKPKAKESQPNLTDQRLLQQPASAETLATFADGAPALVANDNFFYLACWPDAGALAAVMRLICRKASLSTIELPAEVRLRRRGDLTFAFNYGETSWRAPFSAEPLIGDVCVAPRSFSVWRSPPAGVRE
jgi:hypothetical protein